MIIDVIAELNGSVTCHPTGKVDPRDRDFPAQADLRALAGGNSGVNLRAAPSGRVFEDLRCEVADVVDARTPMRQESVVGGKQVPRIRVVHVHRIRVWHVNFNGAERIPTSRILPDAEVGRTG